jgi:Tfp pilus assembly protein PilF
LVAQAEADASAAAGSPAARLNRAVGRIGTDPAAAAREAWALAEELGDHARAWSVAGLAADRAQRWDDAERAFSRALELEPDRLEERLMRAAARLKRGAFSEAMDDALIIADVEADSSCRGQRLAASAALGLGDAEQARDRATVCLELDPSDTGAWEILGRARLELGDVKGALGAATRLRQLDPARGKGLLEWIRVQGAD